MKSVHGCCFSIIGGIDLLLHLLTNITNLPVTKSVVKNSGMGKAIGQIDKHRICAGTLNEGAIKERVKAIKDAWNKSVKSLKEKVNSLMSRTKGTLVQSYLIYSRPTGYPTS